MIFTLMHKKLRECKVVIRGVCYFYTDTSPHHNYARCYFLYDDIMKLIGVYKVSEYDISVQI